MITKSLNMIENFHRLNNFYELVHLFFPTRALTKCLGTGPLDFFELLERRMHDELVIVVD